MFYRLFVYLNNQLTRMRRVRVHSQNLLLLLPRCIQGDTCDCSLGSTLDACKLCGRCGVKQLIEISNDLGVRCSLAAGGREALGYVKEPEVKAVVAIACEKELFQGICAVFPKPVMAVFNIQGDNPCRNTGLDAEAVRDAVKSLLI